MQVERHRRDRRRDRRADRRELQVAPGLQGRQAGGARVARGHGDEERQGAEPEAGAGAAEGAAVDLTPRGPRMSQQPLPVIALDVRQAGRMPAQRHAGGSFASHTGSRWCPAPRGVIVIGAVTTRFGVFVALIIAPAGSAADRRGRASTATGRRSRSGVGHVGICLLFFALVNLLSWGPRRRAHAVDRHRRVYTRCVAWCLAVRVGRLASSTSHGHHELQPPRQPPRREPLPRDASPRHVRQEPRQHRAAPPERRARRVVLLLLVLVAAGAAAWMYLR